jgi:hypothetical protein
VLAADVPKGIVAARGAERFAGGLGANVAGGSTPETQFGFARAGRDSPGARSTRSF